MYSFSNIFKKRISFVHLKQFIEWTDLKALESKAIRSKYHNIGEQVPKEENHGLISGSVTRLRYNGVKFFY